jgi:hypothetical protein
VSGSQDSSPGALPREAGARALALGAQIEI